MLTALAILAGLVLAGLAGAQLVLPRIAERRLAAELARLGEVERVAVRARPALKLLRDRADHVTVDLAELATGAGGVGDALAFSAGARVLDARVGVARLGRLAVRAVRLRKAGARLAGEALLTSGDLSAALLPGLGLRPVPASADGALVLEASAGLLGVRARVRADVEARDGAVVVAPSGRLAAMGSLTVFSDDRVIVERVDAHAVPGGYRLTFSGRLAD